MPLSPSVLVHLLASAALRKTGAPAVWVGMWVGTSPEGKGKKVLTFTEPDPDRYVVIEKTAEAAGNALQVVFDLRELGTAAARCEVLLAGMTEEEILASGIAMSEVIRTGVQKFYKDYVTIEKE